MTTKYYATREATKILGVHPNTLRAWAGDGYIKYITLASGHRRYDIESYLGKKSTDGITICSCRVSSPKQKDDLERPVEFMREKYPDAEITRDIGSGLNFKRKGLKAILERCLSGERITLVAAHRDRLARFGYDLIKPVVSRSSGQLVVLDETSLSPDEELTRDLLSIIHVFSCRRHGLRNYQKPIVKIATDTPTT